MGQIVSKRFIFAAGAVLLAACASDSGLSEEPGYVAGYGDGCATAHEQDKSFSTKRVRDADLFESDRAYRAGWRQGWQQCQSPYRRADDGGRVLGDEPHF
ncbi:MAG: hypothetical protein A3E78_11080 [Alphaproteobacteria bacterium RIFCSPHIGHO2_12_FULL_63_12]|nr:MAG: hypothetical protein A3E78_11080 [Alphaproteobacteria bacterium RIFCSPHIGHO2_12_FULL_63_12]